MTEPQAAAPHREAGAQALFDAAQRVMRHHLGRLDARLRQPQPPESPEEPVADLRH